MRVTIVSPCDLPVPATKGGAVATLIESLIDQNEKNPQLELTIISSYDSKAKEISEKYKHTNIVFVKKPKICEFIDNLYEIIYKKITKKEHKILKNYAWKIYILNFLKKYLLKNTAEKIVLENSGYLLNILKNKKIADKYKSNVYYHLHNDIPDNIYVDGLKKCKILIISNYLSKKIKKACGNNIEKNIMILKNGFNCELFDKKISETEKNKLKEKMGIEKNKKIIVFTGRITEEKGIKELTDAFIKLNREDLMLLVVGSHNFGGSNTTSFEQNLKEKFSKLGSKIKFTGFIPYKEIWKYYKIADLSVLPSIWQEPAGLTMLEACASEVPLITTNSGGIPEYLNEKIVTLLDINNDLPEKIKTSIENFLENEKKYKKMSGEARKVVMEKYNEKVFYNNFLNCINKNEG